jgi:hypothetical protein
VSSMPQRLVLSRTRGFSLDAVSRALNGLPAKVVTRPWRWGNPFAIDEIAQRFGLDRSAAQAKAVALHGDWLDGRLDPALDPGYPAPTREAIRDTLAGHNLACWCRAGSPCHAERLIALANEKHTGGRS